MSLEVKQQCFLPKDVHFYKDKFWCDIMARDVGQIKNITIYGRSIFENLKNVVMRESNILQIINLASISVKQNETFSQTLRVRISLISIIKVTCKLPHTFRVIHLIIHFDRGRAMVDSITQVSGNFVSNRESSSLSIYEDLFDIYYALS